MLKVSELILYSFTFNALMVRNTTRWQKYKLE